MKTRIITLTFLLKSYKHIILSLTKTNMKQIDFIPVVQCVATIICCCTLLYYQSVYPHSNVILLIAICVGAFSAAFLSSTDLRPGNEYTIPIVIGLFVLSWIITPLTFLSHFEGDKSAERMMWFDIYATQFVPFLGVCYERRLS